MIFLLNKICTFKILNNEHLIINNINVIVSVFFKRNEYYKNFDIYIKGLKKVLKFVDSEFTKDNGFIYILFIDQHVANDPVIMSYINTCNNCVPILFKCVLFMKDSYHIDLFGTLVRFFPFFDFPHNPCNIIICIDIDLHDEDYYRLESAIKYKFKDITGAGDIKRFLYDGLKPYIYANLVCFNCKKIDHKIIIDFIDLAKNGKIISKGNYNKRLTNFGFGIDEIFLNNVLIEHVGNVNTLIEYQISYFIFFSEKKIIENFKYSSSILSMIIEKYLTKNMLLEDKLKFIDKNTFLIRKKTEINDYISKRFTKTIDFLVKEKKNWLENNIQNFIYKYLRHVISAILVININYKPFYLTGIDIYDPIYDSCNNK